MVRFEFWMIELLMNDEINKTIEPNTWQMLTESAKQANLKAYAPYSQFHVGSAALTSDNKVVQGCNVENASYGLTVCAERNCIAQGVIGNENSESVKFSALVVYTKQEKLTPPCGACRQVISEFFPSTAQVMATNHLNEQKIWTVAQLLPDAFKPEDLLD
jgi:cytidine deaminase